jgi:hypothetical protein
VTDSQDLEEYWAVIRPLRLPPSPTLGAWLDEPEIWLSIVDSSGAEQTPRIRVTDKNCKSFQGSISFPPVSGPIHIARLAIWMAETAAVPVRFIDLELGINLMAGDTPRVNYSMNLE